jgi:hypothetical protein
MRKFCFWLCVAGLFVDAAMLFNPNFPEYKLDFLGSAVCFAIGALFNFTDPK